MGSRSLHHSPKACCRSTSAAMPHCPNVAAGRPEGPQPGSSRSRYGGARAALIVERPNSAVGPPAGSEAAARLAALVSPEAVDRMLADAELAGVPAEGLLQQLTATVLERALGAELDEHLGYAKGDPAGNGSGNSRNGHYGKTVTTVAGRCGSRCPVTAMPASSRG